MTKKKLIYSILIFIVGIFDIAYGINYHYKKNEDIKSRIKVIANVHQVTKTKKDKSLYLDFYINDKEYNSVIAVENDRKVNQSIDVYCLKSNPTNCVLDTKNYNEYYIIGLGVLVLLINMIGFFKML